jgi:hypothetical protein
MVVEDLIPNVVVCYGLLSEVVVVVCMCNLLFLQGGLDQKHSSNKPIYKWLFLAFHMFTYY